MLLLGFPDPALATRGSVLHVVLVLMSLSSPLAAAWCGCHPVSTPLPQRWHLQNRNRSMKCCGDTGMKQLSGSAAVQGCPESCGGEGEASAPGSCPVTTRGKYTGHGSLSEEIGPGGFCLPGLAPHACSPTAALLPPCPVGSGPRPSARRQRAAGDQGHT